MHGRPREFKHKLKDTKAAEAYKKKVDAIRQGTTLVLECRRQRRFDQPALDAAAKLLKVVPEIYTVWNYRREALTPVFEAGGDAAKAASDGELVLTQACLQENPKSYSTWLHRKWIVDKGLCTLHMELELVTKALEQDPRNFHAWNYRQFVCRKLGRSAEQELQYAEELVCQNFSNYSAWHYRSLLLPRLHHEEVQTVTFEELMAGTSISGQPSSSSRSSQGSAAQKRPIPVHVLDQEYEMVHQAFATDSDDQSPWMYYRWLMGNSLAHLEAARGTKQEQEARLVLKEVLAREVARFETDHISALPDAKWPLLTVARLKEAQARLGLRDDGSTDSSCVNDTASKAQDHHEGASAASEALLEEASGIYRRLMELDPLRRGYYRDAAEGRAFVVVQALGTV